MGPRVEKISGAIGQGKTREEKKKGWQKPRRMKKKRVKRGKEKRRKKRTKWERSKEDARVLSLWWPLKSLAKGEIWTVTEDLSWEDPFDDVVDWSVVSLILVRVCGWCLIGD